MTDPVPYRSRTGRLATSWIRHHPSFLIIGGIRCGTTSLIRYLDQHPRVVIPSTKEVHYFDWNFHRGASWYRSWFPLKVGSSARGIVAGESSPAYLMDPHVPERVKTTMPDARLILLVRDPVERAHSHYRLRKARGSEPADSFAEALADEPRRMQLADLQVGRSGIRLDSYFHQGEYAAGLERWLSHFDSERILTLHSKSLFEDPAAGYGKVLEFLDLPPHDLGHYEVHNSAPHTHIATDVRDALSDRYRDPNARFYRLVGEDFGWT